MSRVNRTDSGNYTRPAFIQTQAAYVDNGSGGNLNAGQWTTLCSPFVHLFSGNFGRGTSRPFQYQQLYPMAHHWAEMRWRNDVVIDATMTMLIDGRRYQILGAIDPDMEHVKILLPLVEYQAQGTRKVG